MPCLLEVYSMVIALSTLSPEIYKEFILFNVKIIKFFICHIIT